MAQIDVINKVVIKQTKFVPFSHEQNTQSIADNLPGGELFRAKNIDDSNFRKFLNVLAIEIGVIEGYLEIIADDYYPWTTDLLLLNWEQSLGIPDKCFKIQNKTLMERRKQVIAKLALMNIITRQQFIDLAAFFGYRVEISSGSVHNVFPMTFPIVFSESAKAARFTMIVKFMDEPDPNVFPYTFPIKFIGDPSDFIRCLFTRLKPAYCVIKFLYFGIP